MKNNAELTITTFNVWAGKRYDALMEYFRIHGQDSDVLCLQEVLALPQYDSPISSHGSRYPLLYDIRSVLVDHDMYFTPRVLYWKEKGSVHYCPWGLAVFVRRELGIGYAESIPIETFGFAASDAMALDDEFKGIPVYAQVITLQSIPVSILNIHGWYGGKGFGKGDSPIRTVQSAKLLDVASTYGSEFGTIICGDFNIRPSTDAFRALVSGGYTSTVVSQKIASTRTALYGDKKLAEPFADDIFVPNSLRIQDSLVMSESLASDHAPLSVLVKLLT